MKTRRIKTPVVTPTAPAPVAVTNPGEESHINLRLGDHVSEQMLGQLRESLARNIERTMAISPGMVSQPATGTAEQVRESRRLRLSELLTTPLQDQTMSELLASPTSDRLPDTGSGGWSMSNRSTIQPHYTGPSGISGERTDPMTGMVYSINMDQGPQFDMANEEFIVWIDYALYGMAMLRQRHPDESHLSLNFLRLDNLVRLLFPHDHEDLCTYTMRSVIRWLAERVGCERLSHIPDYPGPPVSGNDPEEDNRFADEIVHWTIARLCAGHWGEF